jgi:import inner membrane translocase subunit TIM22
MAYDTPYHTAGAAAGAGGMPGVPGGGTASITSLPLKKQLAIGFKDMGKRSWSTAKNFGAVGALFAGIECGIEGLRAKNDLGNGVAAGCLTGAILARNGGPQAAAIGCAGFAAFSAAIDAWMRMPKEED